MEELNKQELLEEYDRANRQKIGFRYLPNNDGEKEMMEG